METEQQALEFGLTAFCHDYYFLSIRAELPQQALRDNTLKYNRIKDYRNREVTIAPVIRLYGTSSDGQKCCVHVHGYMPYFFARVEHMPAEFFNQESIQKFGETLERAFVECYSQENKSTFKKQISVYSSKFFEKKTPSGRFGSKELLESNRIIQKLEIVNRKDFYTFHCKDERFLKITAYSPDIIKPLCKILMNKVLMDTKFQTYEVRSC